MTVKKDLRWFTDRMNLAVYRTDYKGNVVAIEITDHHCAVSLHRYEAEGLVIYRDEP